MTYHAVQLVDTFVFQIPWCSSLVHQSYEYFRFYQIPQKSTSQSFDIFHYELNISLCQYRLNYYGKCTIQPRIVTSHLHIVIKS